MSKNPPKLDKKMKKKTKSLINKKPPKLDDKIKKKAHHVLYYKWLKFSKT